MRLKTTKECLEGKHLYCLRITTINLHFLNDYFIGYYQHQGEEFLRTTSDFSSDRIKVWTSIKNAEKQIRKLYQYHLCKGDIVSIIDEYGEVVKTFLSEVEND
jgi:hypothetical protein